jgi:hypothetical protein
MALPALLQVPAAHSIMQQALSTHTSQVAVWTAGWLGQNNNKSSATNETALHTQYISPLCTTKAAPWGAPHPFTTSVHCCEGLWLQPRSICHSLRQEYTLGPNKLSDTVAAVSQKTSQQSCSWAAQAMPHCLGCIAASTQLAAAVEFTTRQDMPNAHST